MKFLVIVQDLRVSGTSAGIGRRSLLAKLRKAYPDAQIDVHYIIHRDTEDRLELLPVNSIKKHIVNVKIPFYITFLNRFYWRIFNESLNERFIQKQYAYFIKKIDYNQYDHVLVTSSGINHETIMALHGLPILKVANIIFHDPYPLFWYVGAKQLLNNLELFRLKRIIEIVNGAKTCSSTAFNMSDDLKQLYNYRRPFYTLAHHFDYSVFDFSDTSRVRKKEKRIQISYHGALMFGRNIFILVEAFKQLMNEHSWIKNDVEFVLRIKGEGIKKLKEQNKNIENIVILDTLDFSNSSNEQIHESDINVILENGPYYSNILGGKVPFLFSLEKKVLIASPERSELRKYLKDYPYLYDMNDLEDAKSKLLEALTSDKLHNAITKELFSDKNFKNYLDMILNNSKQVND